MTADLLPLRLLLLTLAGWVNRHQQHVIDYLVEENSVLREQLKGRRVRLTDVQRRRLAAKGERLGRQVLRQVATIVTPDTILRWHRRSALGFLQLAPRALEVRILHAWLDTWSGVGLITVGVERLGYRLALTHVTEGEWRAAFSSI